VSAGRVGRPRADRVQLVEEIVALLLEDPGLSANAIVLRCGTRRGETLRLVKAAKRLIRASALADPSEDARGPYPRFPNCDKDGRG
jgi:hypothetical protein